MEKEEYLNYTRGTTLQSIIQQIVNEVQAGKDLSELKKWLVNEQRNLHKKQSSFWQPTISDSCYYRYLDILIEMLSSDKEVSHYQTLSLKISGMTRKKVYALFLTEEVSCWPSLESVFYAAQQDPKCEAALVYVPFFHQNFSKQVDYYPEYQAMGLPVLRHSEYNISFHSPDVVFINKPYSNVPEQYQIRHLECVIPRAIYIPYGMEITSDLAKFGFQYYLHYKAWRHCVYGNIVKEYAKKFGYRNGENIAVWGHPKADHYRQIEKKREEIPEEWKRVIKGRKTILWTPHHLIDLNGNGTGTWLIWGEKILELVSNNPDIVFIFRPHPLMLGALVNGGHMTQSQASRLQQRIRSAENIIWDDNSLYYNAFYAADALITDGTTFCVEFLYTKKPILLTPRNMESFYMFQKMQESYYIVRKMEDIVYFVQMMKDGKDPLREKRLELYQELFFIPPKGTVGEYIVEQMKHELTEECQRGIKQNDIPGTQIEAFSKKGDTSPPTSFPLFSIIVLCYKNTELLFGMLDSIFAQNYPRIQLIVSDDGTEEFNIDTVQQYIALHKRHNIEQVTVRKNEKNLRTVRHIHEALSFAKGDYIVFTAADDRFFDENTISKYVEAFLKNPDSVWIVARCQITSPDYKRVLYNTPTEADIPYFEQGEAQRLFSRWSRRGMAIPCCMAFQKEAFRRVGGIDLQYQFIEDWPLVLKLLRNGYAPLYINSIMAIHSAGGITNSNARYGKKVRQGFYNDKYLLLKNEVDPYINLLYPEDRKAYKKYLKEIMDRHYFFYIDWPGTSAAQKIKLFVKKPIRLWWAFEQGYMKKLKGKIQRKKLFAVSQCLFLVAMLFLLVNGHSVIENLFYIIGLLDFCIAVLLLTVSIITYPLEKYFQYKERLRKNLVN